MILRISVVVGVAAGVASGWLALASVLLCRVAGQPIEFPYLQWLQLVPLWWAVNWYVTLLIVYSAVLPTLLSAGLIFCAFVIWRWRRRSQRRLVPGGTMKPIERGVTDNHGHAAWATPQQLAARFPRHSGCLIGSVKKSDNMADLLFDDTSRGPGHSLIIAGPGSDKTVSAVSRIALWQGPRVVFDPSLEIGPIMRAGLEASDYRVVELGIGKGGVNILDWINVGSPETDPNIRTVVDWIYNEGDTAQAGRSSDPMWGIRGRELVTCLLAYVLYDAPADVPRTVRTLRQFISLSETQLPCVFRTIRATSRSAMARSLAGGLMEMAADETFSSIVSNAQSATEWLTTESYANVVSGSTMETTDILDPNVVVFVQLPMRSLLTTPSVGRAVMGALFNAVFEADAIDGLERILFQLDEAWLLGPMKEIKLCHATARKYLACVSSIFQSEGQIEAIWGRDDAKTIRDTCSWRSYNAVQDGQVADRLSKDIGDHAVLAVSEGDNAGRSKPFGLTLGTTSRGSNESWHEISRALIKPDEILRASADTMFVIARDFPHPVRITTAPYWRYPDIATRMSANRFFQPAAE